MRETELYAPVAAYLERQGYSVHGEVKHLDIVARHPRDPDSFIAVELKTRMSLDLVAQAARRKEVTDSVYVAVPLVGAAARLRNGRDILALLRRLEVGLLTVRFLKNSVRVEPVLHPVSSPPRRRPARARAIIREVTNRYIDAGEGGAPPAAGRLSAYRQRVILTAELLRRAGTASPRELRAAGAPAECGTILSRNLSGWFERVGRGLYTLHPAGEEALQNDSYTVQRIVEAVLVNEDTGGCDE